jgi:methyl-accepting chemotaxis protein
MAIYQALTVTTNIFTSQGVSVAEKAVSLVNGNSFEALAQSLNEDDPFYEKTRVRLLELKQSSNCLYLYTMAPKNGQTWRYIIDGSTTPDDDDNFSPLGTEQDMNDADEAMRIAWRTGNTARSILEYYEAFGWIISVFTPIRNSSGKAVGLIGCDFDASSLHEAIKATIIRQIISGLVSMAMGICLMVFFLHMIFGRLKTINTSLKEISTGEGDLTKKIRIYRDDEIGELGNHFNLTLDKIKNLIIIIKEESSKLFEIGNELADNMDETAAVVSHITGNIRNIKEKVTRQSAAAVETNKTMEQVTENIDRLSKSVDAQSIIVSQSSTAVEAMLANIESVTATLVRNAENVEELISVSDAGRTGLQKVSQEIQEIARESEGLLEINAVMENISSQTNLLSMNAAIEAAHAGEAGKGFAVVADEIRKLAENSGEQSKTISAVLKKIKTAIDTITLSTNTVLEKFQSIEERVLIVSEQETNIRKSMEQQDQGSKQIFSTISELNEITKMVKSGSYEMLLGSKEVIRESKTLETVTEEINTGVNEIAVSADRINDAIDQVSNISNKNRQHINTLFKEVSKFKIE